MKAFVWAVLCPLFLFPLLCPMLEAQQQQAPAPAPAKPAAPQPGPGQPGPSNATSPNTNQVDSQGVTEPEFIDKMFAVGLYHWLPNGTPALRPGATSITPTGDSLDLPKRPFQANGAMIIFPMKGDSRLDVSVFDVKDSATTLTPHDLSISGANVAAGDTVRMDYDLRSIKASYNYLTYPNPPEGTKLRIKTLWEVQFTQIKPRLAFPITSPGITVSVSRSIFLPTVGIGMEYVPSPKHFRIDIHGSGMGFPGRSKLLDGEGTFVFRFGSLEIFGGERFYHFQTSPRNNELTIKGTLLGPVAGVRWVFR